MIPLGPFQLVEPLAKGGMGHVWKGRHEASGAPVAVKFLTHKSAGDPRFRMAFRNEVRAVAALDHNHIATVFDHGEVGEQAHQASRGRLPLGAPWLAMELVTGGTLHDLTGRLAWREVRHVTLSLLDALAHAHARGVIHRDLKPGNVLVAKGRDGLPQVALTDFGLAHEVEDVVGEDGHFYGGTPSYMAPEQFGGQWRDYGPWTDLYGLGCLVWALLRGQPPFGSKASLEEKRRMHLREPPPPLEPPYAVPEGLEPWLRRMLHKDPAKRFRRAADATWALLQLGAVEGEETTLSAWSVDPPSRVDTQDLLRKRGAGSKDEQTTLTLPPGEHGQVALALADSDAVIPPLPTDWRRHDPGRGTRLLGAGIGLFGLRTVPLVDRDRERDQLWDALAEVRNSGRPRLLALTGPAGSGKSRLAEWLCFRAHEVGAATPLRAEHSPIPGTGQGLGPMLRRFLRCYGLTREETEARVQSILRSGGVEHADEWAALTEVLHPGGAGSGQIRFRSSTERFVTVRRLLAALCDERPVVMWLDDVQWGLDVLEFCQYALTHRGRRPLPVLMLVTGTDEALAERADEASLLEALLARPECQRVEVGPLPVAYRATLVEGLLGLDPELAHRVEQRAAGNPQFAVQLVGDWVQRGLLAPGPRGYRLVEGADVRLPADVRALWAARVSRLLSSRSAAEGRALELAAVLGAEVDPADWEAVCRRASLEAGHEADPSPELLDVLLDQRFARTGSDGADRGWTFAHAMLRESLVARAQSFGRLKELHAACAGVLADRFADGGATDWRLAERLGRHLLLADRAQEAVQPLLQAAEARAVCGDYAIADALLDLRDEALEVAFVPRGDERWGEGWMARHQVQTGQGDYDRAQTWLDRLEVGAAAHDWPAVRVRAMCLRAGQHRLAGEHAVALEVAKRAENLSARLGNPKIVAEARFLVAQVLTEAGDLAGAERWARQALHANEAAGYDVGVARVWALLGQITTETGRHEEAMRLLREAETRFAAVGDRWGMASAINSQGDISRYQGRLEEAGDLYRRARGLFRAIGSASWTFPQLNLGLVHLARREFDKARPIFEELVPAFVARGDRRVMNDLLVGLAACAAADQQWLIFDDHLGEAAESLRAGGAVDEDTARLLAMAGDAAVAKGEVARAVRAYTLSAEQWRTLGRATEAAHLDDFVARLRST